MRPVYLTQEMVNLCCFELHTSSQEVYIAVVVVTFTTSCISEVSTCTDEATTTAVALAPAPSGMVIVVGTHVHKMLG